MSTLLARLGEWPECDAAGWGDAGDVVEDRPGRCLCRDLVEGLVKAGERRACRRFDAGFLASVSDQVVERRVPVTWREAKQQIRQLPETEDRKGCNG